MNVQILLWLLGISVLGMLFSPNNRLLGLFSLAAIVLFVWSVYVPPQACAGQANCDAAGYGSSLAGLALLIGFVFLAVVAGINAIVRWLFVRHRAVRDLLGS
ncbi:MAG: hypothetical protein ABIQ30_08400 [Devosia sp.]